MVLFTSLYVKPTSKKIGRNSVGGHFEISGHCRKLDLNNEKFKMAAIQNAKISYEIVYLLI